MSLEYRALLYLIKANNGATPTERVECIRRAEHFLAKGRATDLSDPKTCANLDAALKKELKSYPLTTLK